MGLKFTHLVSYALFKNKAIKVGHPEWNTMLDSGGFTNFTTGKVHVTLPDYINFLREHKKLFWKYFSLDKIGNRQQSEFNLMQMKKYGLDPVPIFQRGNAKGNELIELLKKNDLVAVGGISQNLSAKVEQEYIRNVMKVARKVPNHKIHLLGVGIREATKYNPYSADSSTWASHGRYGILYLWHRGKIHIFQKHLRGRKSKNYVRPNTEITRILYSYGLTWEHLYDEDNWRQNHSTLAIAVGRSWLRCCLALRKKGCKYVLASLEHNLETLKEAWNYERKSWGWDNKKLILKVNRPD